jgi:hypothetical protein
LPKSMMPDLYIVIGDAYLDVYFGSHRIAEAVVNWLATVRGLGCVDVRDKAGCEVLELWFVAPAPT